MPSARYWRISFPDGSNFVTNLSGVALRATPGGANLLNTGNTSYGHPYSPQAYNPSAFYDGYPWTSGQLKTDRGGSILVDFGTSTEVQELAIAPLSSNRPEFPFSVEYGDDITGSAYSNTSPWGTTGGTYNSASWTNEQFTTFVVAEPPPGPDHELTITGTSADVSTGGTTLSQHHGLTTTGTTAGVLADSISLSQAHLLTVTGATAGASTGSVTLSHAQSLTIVGTSAPVSTGSATLSQHHGLTTAGATAGVSTGSASLGQAQALSIAGATAGPATGAVTLTQHHDLTTAGATADTSAQATALAQHHGLTTADTSAGASAAAVALTMAHSITITGVSAGAYTDSTPGRLTLPEGYLFDATITGSATGVQTITGAPSGAITIGAA